MLRTLFIVTFVVLFLNGCSSDSSSKSSVPDRPPEQLYELAQTAMSEGDFNKVATILEAMDSRYPFGPYAVQVQLDLIYVYYKNNEPAKGLANIDRFLRLNPTHHDLDYVYYMRGLTNELSDHNFFQSLFNIDNADRDSSSSTAAFFDYKTLIKRFPNSNYAADSQLRMLNLKHKLARHELAAAQYYIKREAYIAAINRGKYIINNFPDTPAAREALKVMVTGYKALNMNDLAARSQAVLDLNKGA